MRCYRIVKPAYASTALSGEGARLYGGRWNPPGHRAVYAAGSRALAVLEMLVHITPQGRGIEYRLLEVEVPDELVAPRFNPPHGWDEHPAGTPSQNHGLNWLKAARHVALALPSVVIPEESNFLLNPLAPGFERLKITGESTFQLDLRLR
ncbi:RES family NAD+ phosphorylase [Luteolibacter sp. Populi]|uniref:RES family NAD+ phosphorylase n=1 Tax=Luteolibacter sp. Populi TaxID=3230487 RepID=UPI003466BEA5